MKLVEMDWDGNRRNELPVTAEWIERIARRNENMTADNVAFALLAGKHIYTHFRRYKLES